VLLLTIKSVDYLHFKHYVNVILSNYEGSQHVFVGHCCVPLNVSLCVYLSCCHCCEVGVLFF